MNRLGNVFRNALTVIGLCILAIALIFVFSTLQSQSGASLLQPTSPLPCVSTPDLRSQPSKPSTSGLPLPTVTPLPLSKTSDLAPDLSDRDKVHVYVMHCNGTFELFLIRPNTVSSKTVPLQPGDVILDWAPPASLMGPPPRPGTSATLGSPLATPTHSSIPAFSSPLATPTVKIPLPPTSTPTR